MPHGDLITKSCGVGTVCFTTRILYNFKLEYHHETSCTHCRVKIV